MLTNQALWVIERNLDRSLTLGEVAAACDVSRYHLAHAFARSTGYSVMQYVRGRRLTLAAQALAAGAPGILNLALESGYGSHEAFSRAFRTQFGASPEMIRRKASKEDLAMVKAKRIAGSDELALTPPRFVKSEALLVVGLAEPHALASAQDIPAQWRRFMADYYEKIPHKLPAVPLGIATNMDDEGNFEYICGAEVTKLLAAPRGLISMTVAPQAYAVFEHRQHVSAISTTYSAILNNWLPGHNWTALNRPSLERHLKTFNPQTGLGGIEIWIPVASG
jgi:AraC family transcriptional regulator